MSKSKTVFSRKVVFVNTFSVILPVFILLTIMSISSLNTLIKSTRKSCADTVHASVEQINEKLKTFDLIDNSINTNESLRMFFVRPESYNEEEVIDILKYQTSVLENVAAITPYIYSIRIFPSNPVIPERWPMILSESRLGENDHQYWMLNYEATYLGNQNALKQPSLCSSREMYKNHRRIGSLQISVKMSDFFPMVYQSFADTEDFILQKVTDDAGFTTLVPVEIKDMENKPHLSERCLAKLNKLIIQDDKNLGVDSLTSWNRIVAWSYIPKMNLYYIEVNRGKELLEEFIQDLVIIFITLVVLIVILSITIKYITNKQMEGVYSVIDGMKRVKAGDLSVQIPIKGKDEMSETLETFNSMTKQLSDQIEQIKKEQSLIADTEMKAMQNQINAHFLYNVLETIRMQAVLADQDDIAESLQVLGKMMRYCLRWRIHRVSLAQEIDYIRSYIYILNIRNDYTISLQVEIPEDLMDVEIPKMTLQPLIENAFVHAIEETEADGTLRIFASLSKEEHRVYLSVQDFGKGMDEETITKIKTYLNDDNYERDSKGSIGLKNIQQRLTVFYGSDYRLEIKSEINRGTTITVPVPDIRSKT